VKRIGVVEGSVPEELIGKTNRELWDRYGLAIAGCVAPADAKREPRIHGLIGSQARYPQPEIISYPLESEKLEGFAFVCFGPGKKVVAEAEPTDLRPGWNLLSLTVDENRRSFLVYGGKAAATNKGYGKKGGK
jgi:hypothetical protein